jgi:hypothetical protein
MPNNFDFGIGGSFSSARIFAEQSGRIQLPRTSSTHLLNRSLVASTPERLPANLDKCVSNYQILIRTANTDIFD